MPVLVDHWRSLVRSVALAAAVLTAVATNGCGSPAPTSTVTVEVQTEAPTPSPTTEPKSVGEQVSNGGITLTVKAARTASSIELNESGYQPGSGYEKYTKTPAGDGAKFVVVQTHVVNNAKKSLDLTCSLPVSTRLVDDQERQFDPIEDLYKIKGNPECNDQLQPGFESDMTWIYRVPASANVVGWAFQDFTEFGAGPSSQWTVVRLQT
jgi:hypothetical protein